MELSVVRGDITTQDVDAVVNAANGGCAAAAGSTGRSIAPAGPRCSRTACAASRTAWPRRGGLDHRRADAGPLGDPRGGSELRRRRADRGLLTSCYSRALAVADELGAATVAFPLVSAGIYGWPLDDAIDAAVQTLRSTPTRRRRGADRGLRDADVRRGAGAAGAVRLGARPRGSGDLDRAGDVQRGDLVRVETELAQHRRGVLADSGTAPELDVSEGRGRQQGAQRPGGAVDLAPGRGPRAGGGR